MMMMTCRKIGSNAFAKIEGSCPFLSATARRKKSKKTLSSNWAENLADSYKGAMVEGVERAAKRRMGPVGFHVACVAWRFLSSFRAIGKRESRDKERQSREEPGRETTEKPPARMAGIFC